MNRNIKLDERIQILVLHRQGFILTQISDQLNVARATARRWIQRDEEEGSLSDRPRPHPPRKYRSQFGAQNSIETKEPQTSNTNKSSRTKKTGTSACSNKQSAVPTPEKLSDKANKLPEVTKESHSPKANNTSTTELIDTNKRKKKRTADVKLPEVSQASQSSEANNTSGRTTGLSDTNKREKKRTADAKLPEVSQESQSSAANNTSGCTTELSDTNKRGKKRTADAKLPEVSQESQSSEANNTNGLSDTNKRQKKQTADVKLPEAKELIARVYKFLQAEYEFLKYYIGDICDLSPLTNVLKRTADACGVCKYTVRSIVDKARSKGDQDLAGPIKSAKLRQLVLQVSSLAEEESSCDESEKEEKEEEVEQEIKEMEDDSKIKVEESSCSDSEDELDDEDKQMDDDSEESENECEVEAPNMEIDDNEVTPLDPLKTEPVEIMTESTDVGNTQSLDPVNSQSVEVKTETTDVENPQCSSDVITMTSPAPVKTEPDNCTHSGVLCTSDMICDTTSSDIKCEPPGL